MKPAMTFRAIVTAGLFVAASPALTQEYEFIDLGTLGGNHSGALGISESGIISGYATTAMSVKHPVLWIDGQIVDLGAPPGFNVGEAVAVNDAGQAAVTGEGSPQSYGGFLWDNGSWTDLGLLPNRDECIPEDIDASGRIVGTCLTLGAGNSAAFLWDAGVMTDLGTLGGTARAYGINASGQVVGRFRADQPGGNGEYRAFLWEDDAMLALPPLPGRDHSQAFGISEGGDVAGSSWYPTGPYSLSVDRATIWRAGGEIVDLGYTPGPPVCSGNPWYPDNVALAVNDHDQAVGHAQCIASGGALAAFLWSDGVMHNLNDLIPPGSGWDLIKAYDINNAGEIVGIGLPPGGGSYLRAFLLRPDPTAIPEESVTAPEQNNLMMSVSPNPFCTSTRIDFTLTRSGRITLSIHDVLGRRVRTLVDAERPAGNDSFTWNGRDQAGRALPSGVYLLRLAAPERVASRRVFLLQ